MSYDDTRKALAAWKAAFPANPYESDLHLRSILARALDPERLEALNARASTFAHDLVTVVAPAAQRYEQRLHLPELNRYDALGERIEDVSFDPSYHEAGAAVWASGVVALSAQPGTAYEQAVLLYLLSLEGEAGHACPATCTIGLVRALRRKGDEEVTTRFLAPLVDLSYASAQRGAQFLTEVQGGSDVGANQCVATPEADGRYRITGEKWFCSVADADQFFVTARVPDAVAGTRGLGSFVVPRTLDGRPNGFSLRRLKDKLGTRGLASGEIDFDGALAWPVGPLEEGFRTAVSVVLNTSRWMTAVGSAGIMRRAVLEARNFASHREAFGVTIDHFAPVKRTLCDMTAVSLGALHLVMALTELEDRIDAGSPSEEDVAYHRFLVNAAKYLISRQATSVVRSGIEVLGGNGTIEEFSVLPRLYRDAIVYESWEGTHNVLAAQVLNDVRRLDLLGAVEARYLAVLAELAGDEVAVLRRRVREVIASARTCAVDDEFAAWHFRDVLDQIAVLGEAVYLLEGGHRASATHLLVTYATPGYDSASDAALAGRVAAVLATDEMDLLPSAR
ncbi:MAG TPA: acyl-CoA dehydrogenase family protein [Acidimicrobiales bacterium]|nr:acyl-CoA dehydrogenase family protein [Acidimicrobiales bacterium]